MALDRPEHDTRDTPETLCGSSAKNQIRADVLDGDRPGRRHDHAEHPTALVLSANQSKGGSDETHALCFRDTTISPPKTLYLTNLPELSFIHGLSFFEVPWGLNCETPIRTTHEVFSTGYMGCI